MALYYGKHKVRDYEQWRPIFDGDQDRIHRAGAKCVSVMRSTDDPNEVHFVFDVPDLNAFMGELKNAGEVMQKAGVLEQPKIYRLQDAMAEMPQNA